MRFLYAKFTGYIGFYNGLGLSSLEIDFSQAKNKICIISGPNGTGKSTLNNALTLLPDGNDNFVPSMAASKFLRLTDGANIYEILITHPIDKNNNRGVSKASITKNGLELNSNGNISSYKEIIFSEFNLDSNYVVLSKISSDDRGLADKKPAERKKIMSSLISSLEVYNNIFKNLNKKANIFKSYINNLSAKIQNIGDETNLNTTLTSINSRLLKMEQLIETSKEEITKSKTIIAMNDPDGSMQSRYDLLVNRLKESELSKKRVYSELYRVQSNIENGKDMNLDMISSTLDSIISRIDKYKNENIANKADEINAISSISSCNSKLGKIVVSIESISSEINEELKEQLSIYRSKIASIISEFSDLGISDMDDISKSEIDYALAFLGKFIVDIDSLYEEADSEMFSLLYNFMMDHINPLDNIPEIKKQIDDAKEIRESINAELQKVNNDILLCADLSKRPKNCKDDTCPFVNSALDIVSKYGSIQKMREKKEMLEINISKEDDCIELLYQTLQKTESLANIYTKLGSIMESIKSNYEILKKFSITTDLTNQSRFMELIKNENRFNSLRDLGKFFNVSNMIIEYKSIQKIVTDLEKEYAVQENNEKIKQSYEAEKVLVQSELDALHEKYNKIHKEITFVENMENDLSTQFNNLTTLKDLYIKWQDQEELLINLQNEIEDIKKKFDSSFETIAKINDLQQLISDTSNQMKPLLDQRRVIESQLTMLESFKSEYEMYKEKYIIIDKLRKYSSPTQGSIQSLFMSIYMDKTLSMVNQLLGMIFNGQYRILDYVINENEFRIPFIGNGMPVDDISSGSTSQVCIMGTIINLVLYNMSASDFGIASLDEVDGGLDHANRYLFVDIIQKICDILHIDQLFTISHSIESALNTVDVILLTDSDEYKDMFVNANVIYQFERK